MININDKLNKMVIIMTNNDKLRLKITKGLFPPKHLNCYNPMGHTLPHIINPT